MKQTIFLSTLIMACLNTHAQVIQPKVLAVAGSFFSSPSFSLSYTVGEMTAVATASTPTLIITQGFQQPNEGSTGIDGMPENELEAVAFPNPVSSENTVFLSFKTSQSFNVFIGLYDITGRRLYIKEVGGSSGNFVEEIKLIGLEDGMYLLKAQYIFNDGTTNEYNAKLNFIK